MQTPRAPVSPARQVAEAIALALLNRPGFHGLNDAEVVEQSPRLARLYVTSNGTEFAVDVEQLP